jgi:hypothetical protein
MTALSAGSNVFTTTGSFARTAPSAGTVTIKCQAGGGGGNWWNAAGGGGASAISIEIAVTSGQTIYGNVGAGGAGGAGDTGSDGGDSWVNVSTNSAPSSASDGACAAGGTGASMYTAGVGGTVASSVGTYKWPGGDGGNDPNACPGGSGAGLGIWSAGFNYRATAGYVADPAGTQFAGVPPSGNYPGAGTVPAGWVTSTGIVTRDRSTSVDPRLAGVVAINTVSTPIDYQIDLPYAGRYDVTVAIGDATSQQTGQRVRLYDDTTVLFDTGATQWTTQNGQFGDLTKTVFANAAAWLAGQTPQRLTFASSKLIVRLGGATSGANTTIAYVNAQVYPGGVSNLTLYDNTGPAGGTPDGGAGGAGTTMGTGGDGVAPGGAGGGGYAAGGSGAPGKIEIVFTASGGGGATDYTLTTAAGSVAVSGKAVGLKAARKAAAAQGSVALSGKAVALRRSYRLVATNGICAFAGQPVGLKAARTIPAAQGSIALGWQTVGLRRAYRLSAGTGSVALAGQAVGMPLTRALVAAAGSRTLNGQPVLLKLGSRVPAGAGSLSLAGQDAGLRVGRNLAVVAGSFGLTGQDAGLVADIGPVPITWNPADKGSGITLSNGNLTATLSSADSGAVRATASQSTGKWYFEIVVEANSPRPGICTAAADMETNGNPGGDNYTLINKNLRFNGAVDVGQVVGSAAVAGDIIGFACDSDSGKLYVSKNGVFEITDPAAATGGVDFAGTYFPFVQLAISVGDSATLQADTTTYDPPTGYALIGRPAPATLEAGTGAFAASGQAVGLDRTRGIAAEAGSIALAGQPVGLVPARHLTLAAEAGSYSAAAQDGVLRRASMLATNAGAFTFSGQAAGLIAARKLGAGAGTFSLAGSDADMVVAAHGTIPIGTATFALAGQDAAFRRGYAVAADAGSFAHTGVAAAMVATRRASVSAASFTINGMPAGLRIGYRTAAGAGVFALSGQALSLAHDYPIAVVAGSFSVDGQTVTLSTGHAALRAEAGLFALTGEAPGLRKGMRLAVACGTVAFTGQGVDIRHGYRFDALTGLLDLDGGAVRLSRTLLPGPRARTIRVAPDAHERDLDIEAARRRIIVQPNQRTTHIARTGRETDR